MIYPAIDLINNKVVRLVEGDFKQKTEYSNDPVSQDQLFQDMGAKYLHVVDLDGAKKAQPVQTKMIQKIIESTNLKVQVGGGVRSYQHVKDYVDLGADKVIVGSLSVKQPESFKTLLQEFSDHITLSVDVDSKFNIKISGWQESTDLNLFEFLKEFEGLTQVLCTDISKDGKLQGINKELYLELKKQFPSLCFLASGGVSQMQDIQWVREHQIGGVIVGKAIYENKIDLKELFYAH